MNFLDILKTGFKKMIKTNLFVPNKIKKKKLHGNYRTNNNYRIGQKNKL